MWLWPSCSMGLNFSFLISKMMGLGYKGVPVRVISLLSGGWSAQIQVRTAPPPPHTLSTLSPVTMEGTQPATCILDTAYQSRANLHVLQAGPMGLFPGELGMGTKAMSSRSCHAGLSPTHKKRKNVQIKRKLESRNAGIIKRMEFLLRVVN